MFLASICFHAEVWPLPMPKLEHTMDTRTEILTNYMIQKKDDIVKLSDYIRDYVKYDPIKSTRCGDSLFEDDCKIFIEKLNRTESDFFYYIAFLDSILDPMIAL